MSVNGDSGLKLTVGYRAMSFKSVIFFVGCGIAWLVFLPMLVVGGGVALLIYALGAEIVELVTGQRRQPEASAVRELARRLCVGYESDSRAKTTAFGG